jgi:ABC-type polar amino acid transport system ATPase subunit
VKKMPKTDAVDVAMSVLEKVGMADKRNASCCATSRRRRLIRSWSAKS